jgi:outer membrane lipoprotein carrier protein
MNASPPRTPRRAPARVALVALALATIPTAFAARATPPSPAATPPAPATEIAAFVRTLAGLRTFQARFVQVVHDPALHTARRRTGRVWIARPGKFAWVYRTPTPERIVADGRRIWIYDEELEQVTVRPEREALGRRPDLLLAGSTDVRRLYRITYEGVRGSTAWYVLHPRRPGPFVRVALGLRGGVPVAMRLRDRLGERTDLRFRRVVLNAPIPSARFRFRPPPGTAVLGGGSKEP